MSQPLDPQNPLAQLSPEDRAYALKVLATPENKGRSVEDIVSAIHEANGAQALAQPQPAPEPGLLGRVTDMLRSARESVQGPANNLADLVTHPIDRLSRPFEGPRPTPGLSDLVTGEQRDYRSGERLGTGGRVVADVLNPVPGSATQLATEGALLAVPGGPGVKAMLKRLLVPAVTGATVGQLENGPQGAVQGAIGGAVGAGAGEVLRGAAKGIGVIRSRVTPATNRAVSEADAPGLVRAITEDVPALGPVLRGGTPAQQVLMVRDPAAGKAALRAQFAESDRAIVQHFGGQRLDVPALSEPSQEAVGLAQRLGASPTDPAVVAMLKRAGLPVTKSLSAEDALSRLKVLKAEAREASEDALGYGLRQRARQAEDELIGQLPSKLQDGYRRAVTDYDKGLDVLEVIHKSKAIAGDTEGVVLDSDKLRSFLVDNIEKYPPSRFPKLWDRAFAGVPGARDVIRTFSLGRLFMPQVGPIPGGSIAGPSITLRSRPGATIPQNAPRVDERVPRLLSIEALRASGALRGAPTP